METNVYEAVKNNVFALLSLLEIAEENGCPSFRPDFIGQGGESGERHGRDKKRLGELIISCRPASLMRCVSVRFGNVLGSSGVSSPYFRNRFEITSKLTITHPDIMRFFMTTRERSRWFCKVSPLETTATPCCSIWANLCAFLTWQKL